VLDVVTSDLSSSLHGDVLVDEYTNYEIVGKYWGN
jgi:hypothetical protein